jgi:molecular chaperone HscB
MSESETGRAHAKAGADPFALFGVAPAFSLDMAALEKTYRDWQSKVHPDRHAHLPADAQKQALVQATAINDAWQTLKSPLLRAQCLIERAGVSLGLETNTVMPLDFLEEQMVWRERLEEAQRDSEALWDLRTQLKAWAARMQATLGVLIDEKSDWHAAAGCVRQLKFIEKLQHDTETALDALED